MEFSLFNSFLLLIILLLVVNIATCFDINDDSHIKIKKPLGNNIVDEDPIKAINFDDTVGVSSKFAFVRITRKKVNNERNSSKETKEHKLHSANPTEQWDKIKSKEVPHHVFIAQYTFADMKNQSELLCTRVPKNNRCDGGCKHSQYANIESGARCVNNKNITNIVNTTAGNIDDFYLHDFFLTSARVLIPCWWVRNHNASSTASLNDKKPNNTMKPNAGEAQNTESVTAPTAAAKQNVLDHGDRRQLVALMVDQTLIEGLDPLSEIEELFGKWYSNWFTWMEENNVWKHKPDIKHLRNNCNTDFDNFQDILYFFKDGNNYYKANESNSGNKNYNKIQRTTIADDPSIYLSKGTSSTLTENITGVHHFFDEHDLPEELWPGALLTAGMRVKQRAMLARGHLINSHVPKPVISVATYNIGDCFRSIQGIKMTNNSSNKLKPFKCYSRLDVSPLIKTWFKRISPWRRKNAQMTIVFYVRNITKHSHFNVGTSSPKNQASPNFNQSIRSDVILKNSSDPTTDGFLRGIYDDYSKFSSESSEGTINNAVDVRNDVTHNTEEECSDNTKFMLSTPLDLMSSLQLSPPPQLLMFYKIEGKRYHTLRKIR